MGKSFFSENESSVLRPSPSSNWRQTSSQGSRACSPRGRGSRQRARTMHSTRGNEKGNEGREGTSDEAEFDHRLFFLLDSVCPQKQRTLCNASRLLCDVSGESFEKSDREREMCALWLELCGSVAKRREYEERSFVALEKLWSKVGGKKEKKKTRPRKTTSLKKKKKKKYPSPPPPPPPPAASFGYLFLFFCLGVEVNTCWN